MALILLSLFLRRSACLLLVPPSHQLHNSISVEACSFLKSSAILNVQVILTSNFFDVAVPPFKIIAHSRAPPLNTRSTWLEQIDHLAITVRSK